MADCIGDNALENVPELPKYLRYSLTAGELQETKPPLEANVFEQAAHHDVDFSGHLLQANVAATVSPMFPKSWAMSTTECRVETRGKDPASRRYRACRESMENRPSVTTRMPLSLSRALMRFR